MTLIAQSAAIEPVVAAADQSTASTLPQPRLVRAAHEFEAALMKELMSPLLSSSGGTGEDEDEGSGSALTSFAGEAMAKGISEHGGFGIAKSVIERLSHSGNHQKESQVPTLKNRDTVNHDFK